MYEYIKILLVEDEAPLLGAMTLKLKKAGFTVLQGHNGKEGFDLAMKELPNIIITDIVMPEMDGLQMIQNIRKDAKWGVSVPIILLTNLNDFNHVATAMEYGVHDYLVKSNWKLKDLLETVKNKLNLNKDVQAAPGTETAAATATTDQTTPVPTPTAPVEQTTPIPTPTAPAVEPNIPGTPAVPATEPQIQTAPSMPNTPNPTDPMNTTQPAAATLPDVDSVIPTTPVMDVPPAMPSPSVTPDATTPTDSGTSASTSDSTTPNPQ